MNQQHVLARLEKMKRQFKRAEQWPTTVGIVLGLQMAIDDIKTLIGEEKARRGSNQWGTR